MPRFAVWDHKREPSLDAASGRLEIITVEAASAPDAARQYCFGLGDEEERVVAVVDAEVLAAAVNAAIMAQERRLLHLKAEMTVTVTTWVPPLHAPRVEGKRR